MGGQSSQIGFEQVFAGEFGVIQARRKVRPEAPAKDGLFDIDEPKRSDDLKRVYELFEKADGSETPTTKPTTDTKPTTKYRLIGLALSGGGIRSSTFNLGIIQALQKVNFFKSIDYLSTVSGGGYIGSCLSSMLTSTTKFPFEHKKGEEEPVAFRYLRNHSEYLAPKGLADILRIPVTLFRGFLINLLFVAPYVLMAVYLTWLGIIYQAGLPHSKMSPEGHHPACSPSILLSWFGLPCDTWIGENFIATKVLGLLLLLFLAAYPIVRIFKPNSTWKVRDRFGSILGYWLAIIILSAWLELQPVAIEAMTELLTITSAQQNIPWPAIGAGIVSIVSAIFANGLAEKVEAVAARIGLYIVAGLGLLFLWATYLSLVVILPGPVSPDRSKEYIEFILYVVMGGLFIYGLVFVDANHTSLHSFYRDKLSKAFLIKLVSYKEKGSDKEKEKVIHNDQQKLSELNEAAPYHLINCAININLDNLKDTDVDSRDGKSIDNYKRGRHSDFFLFSKKYVGSEITGYCETADLERVSKSVNLGSAMAISGAAAAPSAGRVASLRPIRFLLALLNVRLNYWLRNPRLIQLEAHKKAKKQSELGSTAQSAGPATAPSRLTQLTKAVTRAKQRAMPLVEKAANSKAGKKIVVASKKVAEKIPRNPMTRVKPWYFLAEVLGTQTVNDSYVDLSDGGHIENLGVYELLRRRCKLIVAGDGECDPALNFASLTDVIRMAQIDMGIKIEMDGLDRIRLGRQQHAIGVITYPDDEKGVLIYLKLSLLGDDSLAATLAPGAYESSPRRDDNRLYDEYPYIANYKALNPDFPHESTADQFFDEAQFEVYRALGYHVAMKMMWRS